MKFSVKMKHKPWNVVSQLERAFFEHIKSDNTYKEKTDANGNKHCVDCDNCKNCSYCIGCKNCENCDFCINCCDCSGCSWCYSCTECVSIPCDVETDIPCYLLKNCKDCHNVKYAEDCVNCRESSYLFHSHDCNNSNNLYFCNHADYCCDCIYSNAIYNQFLLSKNEEKSKNNECFNVCCEIDLTILDVFHDRFL